MVFSGVNGCDVERREESPLFCTPPPEEMPVSLDTVYYDENHGGILPDLTILNPSRSRHASVDYYEFLQSARSPDLNTSTLTKEMNKWTGSPQVLHLTMDTSHSSLTSPIDHSDDGSVKERHLLSSGKIDNPHLTRSISPPITLASATTAKLNLPQGFQSLGHLTGYSSSEGDEDTSQAPAQQIQPPKVARRKAKPATYKSAEFVVSDSSDLDLQDSPTKTKCKRTIKMSSRTNPGVRAANATAKKRPLPPTTSSGRVKRATRKGPFADSDTDEDDAEDLHSESTVQKPASISGPRPASRPALIPEPSPVSNPDPNRAPVPIPALRSAPKQQPLEHNNASKTTGPMQANMRPEPNNNPLPTKQINKSRLNKLLGRNSTAQPISQQVPRPSPAQPTNSKPPSSIPNGRTLHVNQGQTSRSAVPIRYENLSQNTNASRPKLQEQRGYATGNSDTGPRQSITSNSPGIHGDTPGSKVRARLLNDAASSSQGRSHSVASTSVRLGTPQLQQNKPVPSANVVQEHPVKAPDIKRGRISQPQSPVQATLNDARNALPIATPNAATSITEEHQTNKFPAPSTPPFARSRAPLPGTQLASNAKATTKTAEPQQQRRGAVSSQPVPSYKAQGGGAKTPQTTTVGNTQHAQKRKAEDITGGSGRSATPLKKPAVAPANTSARPSPNAQARAQASISVNVPSSLTSGSASQSEIKNLSKPKTPTTATGLSSNIDRPTSESSIKEVPVAYATAEDTIQLQERSSPETAQLLKHVNAAGSSGKGIKSGVPAKSPDAIASAHALGKAPTRPAMMSLNTSPATAQDLSTNDSSSPIFPDAGPTSSTDAEPVRTVEDTESISPQLGNVTDNTSPAIPTHGSPTSIKPIAPTSTESQRSGSPLKTISGTSAPPVEVKKKPASVQQEKPVVDAMITHDVRPSVQTAEKPSELVDSSGMQSLPTQTVARAATLTPPISPPLTSAALSHAPSEAAEDDLVLSQSTSLSSKAQPYFEYSVFQKTWSASQTETEVPSTELTVRPFTNITEANLQAEKIFQSSQVQYTSTFLCEYSTKRDQHGCTIFTTTISPFSYPSQKSHTKIFVQRNTVSKYANQTPQTLGGTSFITSTVYILRLFKLISPPESSSSSSTSSSDQEDQEEEEEKPLRIHTPHPRPEIYTTLSAANRAARSLQIKLSHEESPRDRMTMAFQAKMLGELDRKVRELEHGEGGCWRSAFNARGAGGDWLEVFVEGVGVVGPRNV